MVAPDGYTARPALGRHRGPTHLVGARPPLDLGVVGIVGIEGHHVLQVVAKDGASSGQFLLQAGQVVRGQVVSQQQGAPAASVSIPQSPNAQRAYNDVPGHSSTGRKLLSYTLHGKMWAVGVRAMGRETAVGAAGSAMFGRPSGQAMTFRKLQCVVGAEQRFIGRLKCTRARLIHHCHYDVVSSPRSHSSAA